MKHIHYLVGLLLSVAVITSCTISSQEQRTAYLVDNYGAVGDGITDDATAIQKAIDACSAAGGGQVVFASGKCYLSGPVELKSNVDYHLEINSVWRANPDERIYDLSAFGENRGEGMKWIWCKDVQNIAITGQGTIDGNGVAFMGAELEDSYELKELKDPTFDPRPHVLTLMGVKKLQIRDVTICNGAYWTVHCIGCEDVSIIGISLLNNLKIRNGDGIDIDHSRKVRISDCYITSGDDCICLKNRREYEEYGPCKDIVVTNCVMSGRSCAIKIGSENMDSISDVLVQNCVIKASNRGIGIQNRDEGTVTHVVFDNIIIESHLFSEVWWGQAEPIYVTSYPRATSNHKDGNWRFPKGVTEGRCGEVSNIWFRHVIASSENGFFIGCDEREKVHDIYIQNSKFLLHRSTDYPIGLFDKRPCKGEGWEKNELVRFGSVDENVTGLHIDGCEFTADATMNGKFMNGVKGYVSKK